MTSSKLGAAPDVEPCRETVTQRYSTVDWACYLLALASLLVLLDSLNAFQSSMHCGQQKPTLLTFHVTEPPDAFTGLPIIGQILLTAEGAWDLEHPPKAMEIAKKNTRFRARIRELPRNTGNV